MSSDDWVLLFGLTMLVSSVALLFNHMQAHNRWKIASDEWWFQHRKKEAEREAWFEAEMARLDELEKEQSDV